ncbi:DUF2970 domain-containing protein [Congregibacter sp.]|uniref:DUF2970 domain-containing protein n=1 Tax=Congregibacter sp. TaxID=2744308 RepID=UPI003F6C06D1
MTMDVDTADKSLDEDCIERRNDVSGVEGSKEQQQSKDALNPLQVISSVFAAGLGVQSSKNRERDFKQGRAGTFIFAGLVFTALFIGAVYTVVSMVLSSR